MSNTIFLGQPNNKIVDFIKSKFKANLFIEPVCFTAELPNSSVSMSHMNGAMPIELSLQYSYDNKTWLSWSGSTIVLENIGDKVYIKADQDNAKTCLDNGNPHVFVMSGKIAGSGNIQTLLKADGSKHDAPFGCYSGLFFNCSALTQAPNLLATTLHGTNCYEYMFDGCLSLHSVNMPKTLENTYYGVLANHQITVNWIEV